MVAVRARLRERFAVLLLLALVLPLASCRRGTRATPTITFLRVPPENRGGPNYIAEISGRVDGARPGDRIVIYAQLDFWWVQPMESRPFTQIDTDGRWSASTHSGHHYAVLVVDNTFHATAVLRELPAVGTAGVRAIRIATGGTAPPAQGKEGHTQPVLFSGYEWDVRSNPGDRGGIMREYDPANVSVDADGFLHLRVAKRDNRWVCSELALSRSLGYGTYLFQVKDVSGLEPAADLEMFTWSSLAVSQEHSEMDINVGRRGDPANKNSEFVVQPYYIAPNVYRYFAPKGLLTYSFDWEPESVSFMTSAGSTSPGVRKAVASHVFTASIPQPTDETAHINFCAYGYAKVPMEHDAEVVIEKFQYLP